MVEILVKHHQYMPALCQEKDLVVGFGDDVTVCGATFHEILMGGDQLTAARGRGAQGIRMKGDNAVLCLEGLHMFTLDWHTKMNMLEVTHIINTCLHFIYMLCYNYLTVNLEILL